MEIYSFKPPHKGIFMQCAGGRLSSLFEKDLYEQFKTVHWQRTIKEVAVQKEFSLKYERKKVVSLILQVEQNNCFYKGRKCPGGPIVPRRNKALTVFSPMQGGQK